jgi:hypothetical protein
MIHLANDPSANQTPYRPAQGESKGSSSQRKRSGHAWPFLSRQTARPVRQESQKPAASDSGS